jgi:sirohydrochlorin ferrochelatase
MARTRILLVDNGSYEPAATLALRGLAREVGKLIGQEVRPVSTMHSTKIDAALLGGEPAVIFEQAVRQAKADGLDELIVLPLFIGPSRAITEYLPKVFADAEPGSMKLSIRPPLFGDDGAGLTGMLADNLRQTGWTKGRGTVLLCDHGSPIPEVTACRDALAASLREALGLKPEELVACSMERREGAEYDFNEPLLERALQNAKGDAVILMLFLLPGRHAGPEGDVATIAKEHAPDEVRWKLSPLLGTHPALPALLRRRHSCSAGLKLTNIALISAGISAVFAGLLYPGVAAILRYPRPAATDNMAQQFIIWFGLATPLFIALFMILKAKFTKKA